MTIPELARQAIAYYLRHHQIMPVPAGLRPEVTQPAAAFVSLHERSGDLRGCIGTTVPTQPNLAAEIIANAIQAATADPRFDPVTLDELPRLHVSVDVLNAPQPVTDSSRLDPKHDGLMVTAGDRRGVLLPDLDGIDSVDQQITICRQKAGISPNEPVTLQTFTVERFE